METLKKTKTLQTNVQLPKKWHEWLRRYSKSRKIPQKVVILEALQTFYGMYGDPPQE